MRTSHFVMFCSSKLIFMPDGMSAMHSPYSYNHINPASLAQDTRY